MRTPEYENKNIDRHRTYGHRVGDLVRLSISHPASIPDGAIAEVVDCCPSDNNRIYVCLDGRVFAWTAEHCTTHVKVEDRWFDLAGLQVESAGFHSWNDLVDKFKDYRDMNEATYGVTSGYALSMSNGWTVVSGGGSRGGIDFHEVTVFNATGIVLWHSEREV